MLRNILWGTILLVSAAFVAGIARSDTPKGWKADHAELRNDSVGTKTIIMVTPKDGRAGFAWLDGTAFREGTIEVELKGHGVFGIAFGDVGGKGPEELLFETDAANRIRNVSYAVPNNGTGLRKDATSVVRTTDGQTEWCSVKIVVEPKKIQVFFDGVMEPFFMAPRVEKSGPGRTGISVRPRGDASFANFKVTPLDDALPKKAADKKEG
jgi:hypothetical protein